MLRITPRALKEHFSGRERKEVVEFFKAVGSDASTVRVVVLEVEASFFTSIQGVMTRTLKLKAFSLLPRRKAETYVLLGPATSATVTFYDLKIKVGGKEVKGTTSINQFSANKYTVGCSLSKELEEEIPSHSLMTMEMMVQAFVDLVKDKERIMKILEEQREGKILDGYRTHPLNPIYRLRLKTEYVGYRLVEPALIEVNRMDDKGPVEYRKLRDLETNKGAVTAEVHLPKAGLEYAIHYSLG